MLFISLKYWAHCNTARKASEMTLTPSGWTENSSTGQQCPGQVELSWIVVPKHEPRQSEHNWCLHLIFLCTARQSCQHCRAKSLDRADIGQCFSGSLKEEKDFEKEL